ncbi:MAG: hypothetical protein Q8836_02395 [Sweet potato little leaf phytoplasma]|nr:hypothetical protein [Sweet potato little leaf phytoplasma]
MVEGEKLEQFRRSVGGGGGLESEQVLSQWRGEYGFGEELSWGVDLRIGIGIGIGIDDGKRHFNGIGGFIGAVVVASV